MSLMDVKGLQGKWEAIQVRIETLNYIAATTASASFS